ncbi:uracil-xanthine permease family protein [Dehalobacterium formicoaceticum]|uniref:Purine/pyrimidine permease n=1 Tax=Dehalobacterium formicoaceticum TaxID=51515 RepID=A0ABT1Y170_9FIRM|nr:solute carrier family 23 protein [Dehalobacterium formicoaceticum]MCR6544612.1 purine/pyrimidine permease [Dehalobacterium formicoaceticum]
MKFKYGLEDKPPIFQLIAFGLQWLAITVPIIIIVGKIVAGISGGSSEEQILYLQRLFFVVGVSQLVQILFGHRMPLIVGPATVLLVAIGASQGFGQSVIDTSIVISGLILALLAATGLFARLRQLFTPRVVATILILIAFTLTPMILNLITSTFGTISPFENLVFSLLLLLGIFAANKLLAPGFWKSTLLLWVIILGSIIYLLIFGEHFYIGEDTKIIAGFFHSLSFDFSVNPGVLLSFLICFLALSVNDLGSIQSVGAMLHTDHMEKRVTRGITLTGLLNVGAGLFGVVGTVNFSLSPGVIASTGVASRFTLVPTALGLMILAFLPKAIAFMGSIPSVIIGTTMIYIMCSQIAAGLMTAFHAQEGFAFEDGLVMGLSLMLSILISFLPQDVLITFPLFLRPVLGNGFVVGVISVLIMDHIIFRKK